MHHSSDRIAPTTAFVTPGDKNFHSRMSVKVKDVFSNIALAFPKVR